MATVTLDTQQIRDWDTFHTVCQQNLGFPVFYGRNMNAWIDCLTYLDEGDGMSQFHLRAGEKLFIEVPETKELMTRISDIVTGLIESSAAVNQRYIQDGKEP